MQIGNVVSNPIDVLDRITKTIILSRRVVGLGNSVDTLYDTYQVPVGRKAVLASARILVAVKTALVTPTAMDIRLSITVPPAGPSRFLALTTMQSVVGQFIYGSSDPGFILQPLETVDFRTLLTVAGGTVDIEYSVLINEFSP